MQNLPPVFLMLLLLIGASGIAMIVNGKRFQPGEVSRTVALLAALPGVVMVGLFYSLAVHMYQSFGGWPSTIGTRGFPSSLIFHADVAAWVFGNLLLFCMFVWPAACVLSMLIRRWRGALVYLGIFALSCSVGFGTMFFAPSEFLYWWWD